MKEGQKTRNEGRENAQTERMLELNEAKNVGK